MSADELSRRLELNQAFADVNRQISDNHKGIRRSLGRLRTLVVGHYDDVHHLLRVHEFQIKRLEKKLGVSHDVPEEVALKPKRRKR